MTKIKFSLHLVLMGVFFILTIIVTGNGLIYYVDIASLILAVIVPYIVLSFVYPMSEQRALCKEIFSKSEVGDPLLIKKSLRFFKAWKKLIISSAVIWTLMGGIGISVHLEGPEVLGANFGVLMIVPLYTALMIFLVLEPLRAATEKKL